MRSAAIALAALLLSACYVYEPYHPAPAAPTAAPRARPLSQGDAIRIAFDVCRDRGLDVDSVYHASYDREGRWRVELRGPTGDRAKLLLDGESGRLLKGRFRDGDGKAAPDAWDRSEPDEEPAPAGPPRAGSGG